MKKILSTIVLSCLWLCLPAQTLTADNEPLEQLLPRLETLTSYRFYWKAEDVKDTKVSADISGDNNIYAILQTLLSGTDLSYTVTDAKTVFILKDRYLQTTLPSFDSCSSDSLSVSWLLRSEAKKASSENVVYAVGNSQKKSSGKVVLHGTVSSFKTGKPIGGVNVVVRKPTWNGVQSGIDGEYSLEVQPGAVDVEISGTGLTTTHRQLMVYEGGHIDIEIDDDVHTLAEVDVTANRRDNVKSVQMGTQKLLYDEMKLIPTVFGETDVLRIVQTMPGVKTVGEATSGLNVRGGSTDQNLILFNESTVFNPTHLFGFFSAFNSGVVNSAELYKSTLSAQYGGRISSVLDIRGRQGDKEKFTGTFNIGLLTSSMCVEGPVVKGKASLLISGRTTYTDWMLKKVPEKSGYRNGRADFSDLNVIYHHRLNSKNTLAVDGYYSHDYFCFAGYYNDDDDDIYYDYDYYANDANMYSPKPKAKAKARSRYVATGDQYAYTNTNASAKWMHFFNEHDMLSVSGGFDHYDYRMDSDNASSRGAYILTYSIDQAFFRANMLKKTWQRHEVNAGVNETFYSIMPGERKPGEEWSLVKDEKLQSEKALESALYVNDEWELSKRLLLHLGLRYSMYNALGPRTFRNYVDSELPTNDNVIGTETVASGKNIKTYHGPEFRLSFRYAFNDQMSVKGGVNSMRQYIHKISNTLVVSPTDTWKLSDRYIRPQRGTQFSLGHYHNFLNGELEASAEAYYKIIDDYLDYRSGAQLLMNEHLETDVLPTEGRAYGIELMLKKPKGKLNGWISYTYARTELRQSDKRITMPVNEGNWYPAEYDKPHEVKFVGNYKFTKRYSMSLNVDYSTGRPMTMPASRYYDHAIGTYSFFYTGRNTVRIPDYFRTDLSFNILPTHHLTSKLHSSITIGVYNLTGRKNVYSIYFQSGGGVIKGYKMSVFGAPIPFLTYNVKF